MHSSDPLISVIIPAWNAEATIGKCLDALAAQSFPGQRFEVIVVDNGSTDRTTEIAKSYAFVTVLHEPQPSSYRARNLAISIARGEYLLFTDADCVPRSDWIAVAADRVAAKPDVGVHAGRITLFREPGASPFSARYEELMMFDQKGNVEHGFCVTANWLCRRDVLVRLGAFDGTMLSCGDSECARRFTAAGYSLDYAHDMVVGHPTRANVVALVRKRRRVVGGRWQLEAWSKGPFSVPMRRLLTESLNEARRIKNSSIEWWAKPGVLVISAAQLLAGQCELLLLRAGRPAYRA